MLLKKHNNTEKKRKTQNAVHVNHPQHKEFFLKSYQVQIAGEIWIMQKIIAVALACLIYAATVAFFLRHYVN